MAKKPKKQPVVDRTNASPILFGSCNTCNKDSAITAIPKDQLARLLADSPPLKWMPV
jgi:hypothetical protein